MKAAVISFGCKVNQYESQEMLSMLTGAGYLPCSDREDADVFIVNSCTVTEESSKKVRRKLRSLRKEHPDACIVLTGCYSQAFSEEAAKLTGADIVLGNKTNNLLISKLKEWNNNKQQAVAVEKHEPKDIYQGGIITEFEGHTRAFVKIQDGCNRYCTYCIIPKSRGFSRSKPLEDIKKELSVLAGNGFREVVFVGINLSSYGMDTGHNICDALQLAEETDGIERTRLGSLEPDHITDDVIENLSKMKKFCPQFHLSLQSGDDGILKRMNRHYSKAEYTELCDKLKAAFPDLSLTTDIITGFPGETEEAFANSVNYAKEIGFMKVHAFPFSPRKGTPAYSYPDQIPQAVKSERVNILQKEADIIREEYMKSYIGKTVDVLFETPKNGIQLGYTKNYMPVGVKTDELLQGQIRNVVIDAVENDLCKAHLE